MMAGSRLDLQGVQVSVMRARSVGGKDYWNLESRRTQTMEQSKCHPSASLSLFSLPHTAFHFSGPASIETLG